MALTTMDGLIAALAGGQKLDFYKASQTAEGAGTWHSLWKAVGNPEAGANPGSLAGAIPTDATTGAFKFTNPANGSLSYLLHALVSGATAGKLILYDRLWHNSEMSGAQTVSETTLGATPDLTRPDVTGIGAELWGEVYTALGANSVTLNVKYKDQDGNDSSYATYLQPANALSAGQMFPLQLLAGDTGIRKATAYHWSGTTGTAGNFGLVIMRRIVEIPISLVNTGMLLDAIACGIPRIYDDACLALMVQCSTTNTGIIQGSFKLGQG